MQKTTINREWKRSIGNQWRAESVRMVDLPDDYIVELPRSANNPGGGSVGFFPSRQAFYEKTLYFEKEPGTVLMELDGVYENAEVYVDSNLIFQHPYGYTGVIVDLTSHVHAGNNALKISATCYHPGSRWYTGGGIYRDVTLYQSGEIYVHPREVFITTPDITAENATVSIDAVIYNRGIACTQTIRYEIVDENDVTVACASAEVMLESGANVQKQLLKVAEPILWDVDDAHLYTARILIDDEIHEAGFGIRKIEIDAVNGFRLNGRSMKLRGGCIHHDNGMLGSAAFRRAEERKIEILKGAGFNAIRTAHNPPSTALLDACDRLGMLVLDESFDCWRWGKNPMDYHTRFEKWWDYDTAAMVMRDRNHPSVYCWSIGNEIMEFDGNSDGVEWGRKQADLVRSLDPTRPVTSGINCACGRPEDYFAGWNFKRMDDYVNHEEIGIYDGKDLWAEATEAGIRNLDIAGYNYMFRRYAVDRVKYPERVIQGTETRPALAYENWQAVIENPNAIGDFVWVAMDNMGEASMGRVVWSEEAPDSLGWGGWPWMNCWQGDIDICGKRLPISYYRNVLWGLDTGIHLFTRHPSRTGLNCYGTGWHWEEVFSSWTYEEEWLNKPTVAVAYSDADEVHFLLNGETVAVVVPERYIARAEIPYVQGTLEAVAYRKGEPCAKDALQTAGDAAKLMMHADRTALSNDGMDLSYIHIDVTDAEGRLIVADSREIRVTVTGAGVLQGLGSGNPCTEENYGTGCRNAFRGSVTAVVRGTEAGTIHVAAEAEGLIAAELDITVS